MNYFTKPNQTSVSLISYFISNQQKRLGLKKIIPFYAVLLFFSATTNATIHTVTIANFAFNPSNISNVIVGDTVKWVWGDGSHTTTCDPASQGTGNSLPAG